MRFAAAILAVVLGIPSAGCSMGRRAPMTATPFGKVTSPVRIGTEAPRCTEEARAAGVRGTVVAQGVVTAEGVIKGVQVLEGGLPAGMDRVVAQEFGTWRYKPSTIDGEPVSVFLRVVFNIDCSKGSQGSQQEADFERVP